MEGVVVEGVAERLAGVRDRITAAGGDWRSITVVGVTKSVGFPLVQEAYEAGLRDFGENYAQALLLRTPSLDEPPFTAPPRWHFLGAVQRNKVRRLAPHVSMWQGVARLAEGKQIARYAPRAAVMVQVNVTGAPRRNGCTLPEVPSLVDGLRREDLEVRGLMCVASRDDPRADFGRLALAAGEAGVEELSMGMSADLEMAVQQGSTMVRLGSALFGPRPARGTGDRLELQGGL